MIEHDLSQMHYKRLRNVKVQGSASKASRPLLGRNARTPKPIRQQLQSLSLRSLSPTRVLVSTQDHTDRAVATFATPLRV